MKLTNTSDSEVPVYTRGVFLLWLPGTEGTHYEGTYELLGTDGLLPESGLVHVEPSQVVTVLAKVLNQELYGRILAREDCDITLMIRKVPYGLKSTRELPFKIDAIRRYCLSADMGAE